MSEVTYEEAKNSNSVLKELITEGYKTINNFPLEQYFIHEENVEHFIEQYRPPTFEEVVKAWEEAYPDSGVIVDYFRDENFFYIYLSKALWKFTAEYPIMSGISVGSYKVINAINLTIRYLQSQKEGKEHVE